VRSRRTRNCLLAWEDKLRAVNSVLDAARTRHYEMTMPWSVTGVDDRGRRDGPRLLANTLFMEYISEMGQAKQQTQQVLGELKRAYPSMIVEARRISAPGLTSSSTQRLRRLRTTSTWSSSSCRYRQAPTTRDCHNSK
jgi:hypothetical protein